MSNEIPFISKEMFISSFNPPISYYWSRDFSEEFYITLAKNGLISTSSFYPGYGDILLPEMQEAYAVLNFHNLKIGKKVKKLLNTNYILEINQDIETFIPLLQKHHGDDCWFTESYIKLMVGLRKYNLQDDNFSLNTIFLHMDGNITAGEIGYFIGRTYTSLTGFFNRDYNNHGTLQLTLLANRLEELGIDFWNLGHPYMEYKKRLGADILQLKDFLKIWRSSI